jgi:drug/metabolite transporter (DMT)-like permease
MGKSATLILLTTLTMTAFAANSVLCRLALMDPVNDPTSFTALRLFSGAIALSFCFAKLEFPKTKHLSRATVLASVFLFTYALFFSLAYVKLAAGVGALILFASVQLTMILVSYAQGNRLNGFEKMGFLIAAAGFVYLVLPGLNMPEPIAALLMAVAGISWGFYSILGRKNTNAFLATARNFALASIPAMLLIAKYKINLNTQGIELAILSGALTSGLGYILWYTVLKELRTSTAAIVQLSVPILAATAGVLFLGENLSQRLLVAGFLVIIGIFIKIKGGEALTGKN